MARRTTLWFQLLALACCFLLLGYSDAICYDWPEHTDPKTGVELRLMPETQIIKVDQIPQFTAVLVNTGKNEVVLVDWGCIVTRNSVYAAVRLLRGFLESLGPAITFRKLHGILNALEMQVEDERYQRQAVNRLCEALLATAELYDIDEKATARLQELVSVVIDRAERDS